MDRSFPSEIICPLDHDDIQMSLQRYSNLGQYLDHLGAYHQIQIHNPMEVFYVMQDYISGYSDKQLLIQQKTLGLIDEMKEFDSQLRFKLQQFKLKEMLKISQEERLLVDKLYHCPFCKKINLPRVELFEHFHTVHSFMVGLPDNIVNLEMFLKIIRDQLEKLYCIYCEVQFRDAMALRKHMRKKKHFRVNPRNHSYDQFYMINYLCPGLSQHQNDISEDELSSSSQWSEIELSESELLKTTCLFCDYITYDSDALIDQHMKDIHSIDLKQVICDQRLDIYGAIKLINYIRRKTHENQCAFCDKQCVSSDLYYQHVQACINQDLLTEFICKRLCDDTMYLIPTYEEDGIFQALENLVSYDDNQQAETNQMQ